MSRSPVRIWEAAPESNPKAFRRQKISRRVAPHRGNAHFRALRAREGGSEIQNPKIFGGRIFWRGMRIQIRRVLDPPTRSRTFSARLREAEGNERKTPFKKRVEL